MGTVSSRRPHVAAAAALIAAALIAGPARAGNEAAAEALFSEAKKLVAQKRYAEACSKFAESNRLDRGAGTLIHLADCYEKNKQTASAWATYKEAASAAQALSRKQWETLANQRAAALEPKLARITVTVPSPVAKVEVARDGEKLTEASWGVALPVDVGPHTFEVSAPGHKPFTTTVTIAKDGERKELALPRLEALPAEAASPTAAPSPVVAPAPGAPREEAPAGGAQRTVGLVLAGVGVAGLVVGGVTGVLAMGKNDSGKAACPEAGACASRQGVDDLDAAKSYGTLSTIGFGAGGALLVGGAVLYLTAPSGERKTGLRVAPTVSARQTGLVLGGTF